MYMRRKEEQTAYKYQKSCCIFELPFFALLLKETWTVAEKKRDTVNLPEGSLSATVSEEETSLCIICLGYEPFLILHKLYSDNLGMWHPTAEAETWVSSEERHFCPKRKKMMKTVTTYNLKCILVREKTCKIKVQGKCHIKQSWQRWPARWKKKKLGFILNSLDDLL